MPMQTAPFVVSPDTFPWMMGFMAYDTPNPASVNMVNRCANGFTAEWTGPPAIYVYYAGDLLIVTLGYQGTGPYSISDTAGNDWTQQAVTTVIQDGQSYGMQIFTAIANRTGITVFSTSADETSLFTTIACNEYNGSGGFSLDNLVISNGANGTPSLSLISTSATPLLYATMYSPTNSDPGQSLWSGPNYDLYLDYSTSLSGFQYMQGGVESYVIITPPPISLSLSCALGTGNLDEFYSSYLIASGGVLPYTFSIIAGSLPPGLTLNAVTGLISGTPVRPGNYSYTAEVVDSTSPQNVETASCSIFIGVSTCYLVDFPVNGPFYDPMGRVLSNGYLLLRLVFDCNCPCADYQITGNNHTRIPLDVNGMVPTSPPIQIRPNDQLKPGGSYYILQAYSETGQLCLGSKILKVLSS